MKITANTRVENLGWTVTSFDVGHALGKITAADFTVRGGEWQFHHAKNSNVTGITPIPDGIRIHIEPICYDCDFRIIGSGAAADLNFGRKDITKTITEWADRFEAKEENGVLYRLYSPDSSGPRPMVLFLHGGGECGRDNWKQMVGTLGAARIAEDYPDVFVMAPQAPEGLLPLKNGKPVMPATFAESNIKAEAGWHRKYLANICDIIRKFISEGKVNPDRVYVTGLSMGGGGTLRALSVGSGLFAAAVPVCPTMTPETYGILCGLSNTKIWISTAYVDHTIYRHKYIVDGILKLRDAGNNNAKLTLYSAEELAKYDIATDPDMPYHERFAENHSSWILTYNNEYGIMDWLMSQTK